MFDTVLKIWQAIMDAESDVLSLESGKEKLLAEVCHFEKSGNVYTVDIVVKRA